jgi:hypothetical protein
MKKKIGLLLAISVILAVLGACDFTLDTSPVAIDNEQSQLHLTRAEILALQHLEASHERTQEELQVLLTPFLGGGDLARSVGGSGIVIAKVERHIVPFEDGFVQRGRSAMPMSEIPFYVFTLENQDMQTQGFAIASGDTRVGCILAVVEYGEIDLDIPFLYMFFSMLGDYVMESIEIFNSVTTEDIQAAIKRRDEIASMTAARMIQPAAQSVIRGPMLVTAWGQGHAPTSAHPWGNPYWDVINAIYERQNHNPLDKYVTGCWPVAIAQIMAFHRHPARPASTIRDPRDGRSITSFADPYAQGRTVRFADMRYNWGGPQGGMTTQKRGIWLDGPSRDERLREIGVLMFEIASRNNLDIDYGTRGGRSGDKNGSFIFNRSTVVPRTLGNMGYRTNETNIRFINYNLATVQASIRVGRPVIIRGDTTRDTTTNTVKYSGGHAWIIDGYRTINGVTHIHCDLGWSGQSNGWYYSGVFDINRRNEATTPTQRSIKGTSGFYQFNLLMIPHIRPR